MLCYEFRNVDRQIFALKLGKVLVGLVLKRLFLMMKGVAVEIKIHFCIGGFELNNTEFRRQ